MRHDVGFVNAISAYVRDVSGSASVEVVDLVRLSGGAVQENIALELELEGGPHAGRQSYVLRTDAPTQVATSLGRVEEFSVLRAAALAGVAVPEPLWLCDDPSVIGRPFYLMRRLWGEAAAHHLVRGGVADADREPLLERLGEELARLHTIRPGFPGLEFLPEPDLAVALLRVHDYRYHLDALPDPHPVIEWALRWLERRAPPEGEVVLCHGDFRTGNYLVEDGELRGLLDWEFASFSDPLEDLGWFCARCWRFGASEREAGGIGPREALYRGYERGAGITLARERIPYWEVMATVRWSIIALQQAQRHLRGEEASLELALTGRMVPEMELDMLQQIEAIRRGDA